MTLADHKQVPRTRGDGPTSPEISAESRYSAKVGMELKVLRIRAGLLARDVAKAAGVHVVSLSKIERGVQKDVGVETLTKIAGALGLKGSDVLRLVEG